MSENPEQKDRKNPRRQGRKWLVDVGKMGALGLSFGVCLGLQIYVLGILLGGWLDRRFDSSPWCLIVGVLLAIVFAFRQLFVGLRYWEKRQAEKL